eukprot:Gregarina_sp_Pseudo_9__353@NODE_1228_length_1765_cov_49_309386_g1154_i0_p2_GENE_NODE_1228_length_1765_cov_49_309386_g1154_i0NODE_1228_length_1765_cov_49_309386_g1154_i0_p2_ORF_typecomplete_len130_score13_99_NODE_1228_length_1765_cov_49_309386_g1154_i0211600
MEGVRRSQLWQIPFAQTETSLFLNIPRVGLLCGNATIFNIFGSRGAKYKSVRFAEMPCRVGMTRFATSAMEETASPPVSTRETPSPRNSKTSYFATAQTTLLALSARLVSLCVSIGTTARMIHTLTHVV